MTTQTYRALRVSQLQVHAWNYGRHEQNDSACTLPACSEKHGDQTLVRRRSRRTQSLHQPSQAKARTHKQNARTPERQGRTTRAVVAAAVRTPEQLRPELNFSSYVLFTDATSKTAPRHRQPAAHTNARARARVLRPGALPGMPGKPAVCVW